MRSRRDQGRLAEQLEVTRGLADRLAVNFPAWRAGVAAIYAELGCESEARFEVEALAGNDFADLPRDFIWLGSMSWLGEACAMLADRHRAGSLYELMLPHARKHAWAGYNNVPLGPVSRVLGLLATVLGRWNDASHHFENALSLAARMGARPSAARTQQAYADMLLRRDETGDRKHAVELLDAAARSTEELGMDGLREASTRLRQSAAVRGVSLRGDRG